MNFRELKIEDKEFCNSLINEVGVLDSSYSFTNWFIWSPAEKTTFSFHNNFIILRSKNNEYAILCNINLLDNVMSNLIQESKSTGGDTLFMYGITEQFLDYFVTKFGDKVDIKEDLAFSDYVYNIERIKYLNERKLKNKRNLINRFNKLGRWNIKILPLHKTSDCKLVDSIGQDISCAHLQELIRFVKEYFYSQRKKDLKTEEAAVYRMLRYYNELNVLGLVLYLDDKAVSFSAGTQLNDEIIDVHFEFSLPEYKGANQLICREFANCASILFPSVKYLNWEEDLGLDGLRQAKRSYKPDFISIKYTAKISI